MLARYQNEVWEVFFIDDVQGVVHLYRRSGDKITDMICVERGQVELL